MDGLHARVVVLVACATVRLVAATDGALLRSPEYSACIVSEGEVDWVVKETVHFPLLGMGHEVLVNVPAAVLDQMKLPVGALPPVSAAVHETALLPTTMEVDLHVTVDEVDGMNDAPL